MNNRMRKELDHIMQNITFTPAMIHRVHLRTHRRSLTYPVKRAIAIAIAAILLSTGALAAGMTLLEHLRGQMGPFGSQVVPVVTNHQAEAQGFRVQALASMSDSYNTTVFFSVEDTVGGRLDAYTHLRLDTEPLNDNWVAYTFGCRQLSFDAKTQTALFELSIDTGMAATVDAPVQPEDVIQFTIDEIIPGADQPGEDGLPLSLDQFTSYAGPWTISTTIERAAERTLSQPVNIWVAHVTDARLSPLGLYVSGSMETPSSLSNLVITMKDGAVYSYPGLTRGGGGPDQPDGSRPFQTYWSFCDPVSKEGTALTGPLDIDQVAKVTVSGIELPFAP